MNKTLKSLLVSVLGTLVLISAVMGFSTLKSTPTQKNTKWIGSWHASQSPFDKKFAVFTFPQVQFENQTIRMVLHPHYAGSKLRLKFSNRYGAQPLLIQNVEVARYEKEGRVVANTSKSVTFGGKKEVIIPVGKELYSDEINHQVKETDDLAVSVYVPKRTKTSTWHFTPSQTTYVAEGNHTKDRLASAFQTKLNSFYWLSGMDVKVANKKATTVVAFGDSITEGVSTTPDTNHRWTDYLDEYLDRDKHHRNISILNAGISGNQILKDGSEVGEKVAGEKMLARMNRDVFSQAGVREVIFHAGINDIGMGDANAKQIIDGMKTIAQRAHQKNLRIYVGTITPFKGSVIYTAEKEKIRQEVNHWIHTNQVFDGVIDFDQALADPKQLNRLLPAYDGGDHLHPNDAGNETMAKVTHDTLFKMK